MNQGQFEGQTRTEPFFQIEGIAHAPEGDTIPDSPTEYLLQVRWVTENMTKPQNDIIVPQKLNQEIKV
ncbi:MAG: hypothetical protein EZS28_025070 [Streblomastix strix]|uniref:Uncharacterized protein n=1 Tax=Streblomastix strix TaxID=222440 RepID=A0A5J4VAN4_9EUKA|nr:MAG: hypothetical protein EZS28_025070 [Streblomastix strix]